VHTDGYTDTQMQTSYSISPMPYAIAMRQMINMKAC